MPGEHEGWSTILHDPMTGDWRENWLLDGEAATLRGGPAGLEIHAGPEYGNDSHHVVLWTKQEFRGDIRVDFEFTRLDSEVQCVNIAYIHATGSGAGPHSRDIREWAQLRREPAMRHYFDHMHAYHVSFAAWEHDNAGVASDYIRARRYMPERSGLEGTELPPAFRDTGLFETGVPHRVTVTLRGELLEMRVRNDSAERAFRWDTSAFPPCTEGRVGLRLMFTRSSRFRDLRVMQRLD